MIDRISISTGGTKLWCVTTTTLDFPSVRRHRTNVRDSVSGWRHRYTLLLDRRNLHLKWVIQIRFSVQSEKSFIISIWWHACKFSLLSNRFPTRVFRMQMNVWKCMHHNESVAASNLSPTNVKKFSIKHTHQHQAKPSKWYDLWLHIHLVAYLIHMHTHRSHAHRKPFASAENLGQDHHQN